MKEFKPLSKITSTVVRVKLPNLFKRNFCLWIRVFSDVDIDLRILVEAASQLRYKQQTMTIIHHM